jgi:hypothetical protein
MKMLSMERAVEQAKLYGADAAAIRVLKRWKSRAMTHEDRLEYRWAARGSQCSRWMIELALAFGRRPFLVRSRFYKNKMSINDAARRDARANSGAYGSSQSCRPRVDHLLHRHRMPPRPRPQ